jgi:Phage integrase family
VGVDELMRTPCRGELVWPGPRGEPMPASSFCTRWAAMRRRAGIRPVNFHALRHTAATLALEDGISPPHVVATMLGRASIATTLAVYAHVTRASLDALTEAINARHPTHVDLRVITGEAPPHDEGRQRVRNWKPIPNQGDESAEEGTRTLTRLPSLAPQASVSTNSTTSARSTIGRGPSAQHAESTRPRRGSTKLQRAPSGPVGRKAARLASACVVRGSRHPY